MRAVVFVIAVAALGCGGAKPTGPAWPAPSTTAEDGGESVAPRPSATYAAALEKSADEEDKKPAAETASSSASDKPTEDKPATTSAPTSSQPTIEDVFMSEDIIIEIEE